MRTIQPKIPEIPRGKLANGMEIPVKIIWVYLLRFSSFPEICVPFAREIFGISNQKFLSNGKRHKFVSVVNVNECVSGWCKTRQYIGRHVINVSVTESLNVLSRVLSRMAFSFWSYTTHDLFCC